jgi:hypothetical protein
MTAVIAGLLPISAPEMVCAINLNHKLQAGQPDIYRPAQNPDLMLPSKIREPCIQERV